MKGQDNQVRSLMVRIHSTLTEPLTLGLRLLRLIYVVFLSVHPLRFACATVLNFLGRAFSLGAFVISIQAVYIAFQSSISHGGAYKGKAYVDMIGLPETWLPWVLAACVAITFAMPALLKRFETRLIAQIAKENHRFAETHKVMLLTDLFVTQRGPQIMTYLSKFCSGILFILAALAVVAIFRFDLFVLVLLFSLIVGGGVIAISLRNILKLNAQIPLRAAYVTEAQFAHDPKRKQKLHLVHAISATSREQHFRQVLNNWATANRAVFNQAIFSGLAIAAVVLFVFRLDNLDNFQLFLLLYLVIAIRYAINTARETGLMASKVLEVRVEMAALTELYNARKGRDAPNPEASEAASRDLQALLDEDSDLM